MTTAAEPVGRQLRAWRQRRRISQLDLSAEADVSQRHLSYIESGRSRPSRDMVLKLAEHLAVPVRERNSLLLAAGYAPHYAARPIEDPDFAMAREAVAAILAAHMPYPALAVDRHWRLLLMNDAVAPLLAGADAELLRPPVNVLRLSLHPRGLGPRILNYRDWRNHVVARLAREAETTGDAELLRLRDELRGYPVPAGAAPPRPSGAAALAGLAVPLELAVPGGRLSLISTTTVFGTAVDVTLAELTIEQFFPADTETAAALRAMAAG